MGTDIDQLPIPLSVHTPFAPFSTGHRDGRLAICNVVMIAIIRRRGVCIADVDLIYVLYVGSQS